MKDYEYFSSSELKCKCESCEGGEMDDEFMAKLVAVRERVGVPMTISSGYRCPAHNNAVSHSGRTGAHTTGRAVDIRCSGNNTHAILTAALAEGMQGIGVAQKGGHKYRYLHLDDLTEGTRPWVWSY